LNRLADFGLAGIPGWLGLPYVAVMIDHNPIRERFSALSQHLDERSRRVFAAAEAKAAGHGGIAAVWRATGIAPSTINRGLKELAEELDPALRQVRRPGGGRKSLVECDEQLHTVVGELLKTLNFSLQANSKTREGDGHPDRDAQFRYVNRVVKTALNNQQPVISVDTKKKELVGDFKNGGREWRPKGQPEKVRVHDFLIKELGRAVPYGVYDLAADTGWVCVGIDHDTAAFAVQTIRRWWQDVGRIRYPEAERLLITADGGGSNGSRLRLWERELQHLANEIGIEITVSHFPPGTSKWNKIEHRLFSFITQNWRAKPLISYRVIVNLISATTTCTGLSVHCELDTNRYPKAIVVTDEEMETINIKHAKFHGEWNYTIRPNNRSDRAVDS
jgi:Rhodopirellula transposase DDE domain